MVIGGSLDLTGNSSVLFSLDARQLDLSGQKAHRGLDWQSVAPSSMSASAVIHGFFASRTSSAND